MKTNIFFFISNFSYGGAGNAILNFLKNLNRKKYNIYMIFLDRSDYDKFLPSDIKVIRLISKINIFKTFFCFFKIKEILLQSKISKNKNIFISNINYSNVLSILFLRRIKYLKLILFERTSLRELDLFKNISTFIKNKVVKFLIKYTYERANKILTNSKKVSLELKKYHLKSNVVYSGSINKIFKNKRYKKKSFFNIVAVGRLSFQKDYLTLLKAAKLIKNKKFLIKIYGDGELKEKLNSFIMLNNLNKHVRIFGHQHKREIIYKKADLLVHPAIYEGLPNSIVESLNYGVPVIAAKGFGGTSEVLKDGKFGQLFESKNEIELAKKIDQFMLDSSKLENKVKKSKTFIKNFTYKNSCRNLEKILMTI